MLTPMRKPTLTRGRYAYHKFHLFITFCFASLYVSETRACLKTMPMQELDDSEFDTVSPRYNDWGDAPLASFERRVTGKITCLVRTISHILHSGDMSMKMKPRKSLQ